MAKKDNASQAPAKKKKNAAEAKPFTEAARLRVKYNEEIIAQLKEKFGYENVMQVPKLEKIVLNMGLGSEKDNPKGIESALEELSQIAGQVIATPGCESNVKEIFDKTWELKQDPSMMIFNQFAEMGNPLWHYNVTGYALSDLFENVKKPGQRLAGACFTSGSAGTMSAGDLLKERYPGMKLAVGEALQCPTILDNGFGGHRIEGIGDKHIPWVHNVKNTDMVIDIDDEDSQRLLRLFNCKEGQEYLKTLGLSDEQIEKFTWMGISGIANVLCCIKMAKFYELTEDDVVVTVLTDSAVMYKSRVEELNEMYGAYSAQAAELDHNLHMLNLKTDNMMELTLVNNEVHEEVDADAQIIFGAMEAKDDMNDEMKITVIAAGFDDQEIGDAMDLDTKATLTAAASVEEAEPSRRRRARVDDDFDVPTFLQNRK